MNKLQIERRLRRLEEKVQAKTRVSESKAPAVIRFPGGNLKVDKTGRWFSTGRMPEGIPGYVGYLELRKTDFQETSELIGRDFSFGMIMFYYDKDESSPYTVDINLFFGEEDNQVCLTKQETFDTFEDSVYYITSEVRNPYSLSEPITNKRIWQMLYH